MAFYIVTMQDGVIHNHFCPQNCSSGQNSNQLTEFTICHIQHWCYPNCFCWDVHFWPCSILTLFCRRQPQNPNSAENFLSRKTRAPFFSTDAVQTRIDSRLRLSTTWSISQMNGDGRWVQAIQKFIPWRGFFDIRLWFHWSSSIIMIIPICCR